MLIDVSYSLIFYLSLVPWTPTFYYIFAGLAIVLGFATDFICRTRFNWYNIRFLKVFISLIAVLIVLSPVVYSTWLWMIPPGRFEMIEIEGMNANRNGTLVITLNYSNTGSSDATVKNILIDGKPVKWYITFVDVYDSSGNSINNLLDGKGFLIPVGKKGNFTIVFREDVLSGDILNVEIDTEAEYSYNTSCRVP